MRGAPLVSRVLLLAVVVSAAALPVRAETQVALLPTGGDAPRATRKWVDALLRSAAGDLEAVRLQDADETSGHMASLEDLGMVCRRDDVQCLVKLGIVAGVEGLLVPALEAGGERAGGEVEVELDYIEVAAARRMKTSTAVLMRDDEDAARALVRGAFVSKDGQGADGGASSARPPDAAEIPQVSEPVPWPAIALGVGAVVTSVALPAAVISELLYAKVIPGVDADTRASVVQPLGMAMWITTAVGVATAGIGGAIMVAEHDATSTAP